MPENLLTLLNYLLLALLYLFFAARGVGGVERGAGDQARQGKARPGRRGGRHRTSRAKPARPAGGRRSRTSGRRRHGQA